MANCPAWLCNYRLHALCNCGTMLWAVVKNWTVVCFGNCVGRGVQEVVEKSGGKELFIL